MAFDKINKKSVAMGKKPQATFLKVNKYESPQMALDLIAHICTASADIDLSSCFEKYYELQTQMENDLESYELSDSNFPFNCWFAGHEIQNMLFEDVSSTLKIAVAGGYSAGKSSLLNYLTGIGDLLPTGVDPVSVVNTYLNCVPSKNKLIIRGKNLKNDLVLLNEEVLACIQHSSKSKVYIANVLEKIIIDTPAPKYLERITFIDTPGYNNSTNEVEADRDKAISALKGADAVFWCIDIESGTITNTDIDILKNISDKPIGILFTKSDKKNYNDVIKIIKDTEKKCYDVFGSEHAPIVVGVSCLEKKMYSTAHLTFQNIVEKIKSRCGVVNLLSKQKAQIEALFDKEVEASTNQIIVLEEERKKLIQSQNEDSDMLSNNSDYINSLKDALKDTLISSYTEVEQSADKRGEYFNEAMSALSDSLNREFEWNTKVGLFSDASALRRKLNDAVSKFNKLNEVDIHYTYWEKEYRTTLYGQICERLDDLLTEIKDECDSDEQYKSIVELKKKETQLKHLLIGYKPRILRALSDAYYDCLKRINDHNNQLQTIKETDNIDVFSAISGDNYGSFLSCFSNGVDLTVCNKEGFSPLTWAVRSGNNEMVKFFINHEVDLTLKDKRGYNALETAAIYHYQDICELLMEADNSLISNSRSLVEMSQKNYFTKWVSQLK